MSSEQVRATRLLAVLLLVTGGACADLGRGAPRADAGTAAAPDATPGEGGPGDAGVVSFARDVHQLVLDGCVRCHARNGTAGTTAFILVDDAGKDRTEVLKFVNPDNPPASRFLAKSAGAGHGGGAIYAAGTPEYRIILDWIVQGSAP